MMIIVTMMILTAMCPLKTWFEISFPSSLLTTLPFDYDMMICTFVEEKEHDARFKMWFWVGSTHQENVRLFSWFVCIYRIETRWVCSHIKYTLLRSIFYGSILSWNEPWRWDKQAKKWYVCSILREEREILRTGQKWKSVWWEGICKEWNLRENETRAIVFVTRQWVSN